jgi:hypothetical protein
LDICPEAYEHDFGSLRPVIPEVLGKFMDCGDFANGFARVRAQAPRVSLACSPHG